MHNNFLQDIGSKRGEIKKQIIKYCLKNGNSFIPAMAKDLGYSVPTITKYVTEMCESGYLSDFGKYETNVGRFPSLYGVNPDASYFIGVDVNRFSLSIGAMNFTGDMIKLNQNNDFRFENTKEKLEELCNLVKDFIANLKVDKDKILNINFNLSGRVNSKSGYSHSVFEMCQDETPLADVLTEIFGRQVTIENDTRAMTFGEFMLGNAKNYENVLFVNISWGLGLGMILNGEIYYGKSGYSGEFGHINVFDNEIRCHCGKNGCLETEVSGMAMQRKLIQRIQNGAVSILSDEVENGKEITTLDMVNAIEQEDTLCIDLLEEIGGLLGKQIANLTNLFNPEAVILGGALSMTDDYLLRPVEVAIRKYALKRVTKDMIVTTSKLKDKAGVVGACIIARYRMLEG